MYLKAIELHGFKSFPDKTRVTFDRGMTAVVGPNGSGKSNISDAIRWVLGETSGKELRATGKMEDIIFGGTQRRGPMGFAMVSLILDNSDRSFEMDYDEISVTRKYYRAGEGEYFINSNRVRLKDIYELFLDTGLGKSGYSMVGQGKISQIVTAKPEGRREIFEEASGIAKFRYKKNEAEKKLLGAQENILRLTDILTNLEERVGPLEKESKKAKEFVELAKNKKGMEISLWLSTVDKSKEVIRKQQRNLEILQEDYDNLEAQILQKEQQIEKRYFEANSLLTKGDENVTQIRVIEQELSEITAQRAVLYTQIEYNKNKLEQLEREISMYGVQGKQADEQRVAISEKLSILLDKKTTIQNTQLHLQEEIISLTTKTKAVDEQKGGLLEEINRYRQIIQDKKIVLHGIDTQNIAIAQSLKKAECDLENATQYVQDISVQVKEIKAFVFEATSAITKNNNIKNGLAMKLTSVESKTAELLDKQNKNQNKQLEIQNKIRLLTDMENNLDGFQQSVKTVLSLGKNGKLFGIEGTVAQLISVEKGYEIAVEIALGYALQNIIVADESSAKRGIELLKSQNGGRATFLPLDTVKPSSFTENLPEWATTGDKVVKANEKYGRVISNLLARTIIVEDISLASRLAKQLSYRYKIVTMDGQQINTGGSFTGGSLNKSAGLFTRKGEIEKLKESLDQIKKDGQAIENEQKLVREAQDLLSSQIAGCDGEISVFTNDKVSAEIELAKQGQLLQQYEDAVENAKGIIDNCKIVTENNEKQAGQVTSEIAFDTAQIEEITASLEKIGQIDRTAQETGLELTDSLQQAKLDIVQILGDIGLLENNLSQININSQQQEYRKLQLENEMSISAIQAKEKQEEIICLEEKSTALKERIVIIEEENKSFITLRFEIEKERNEVTQATKQMQSQKEELSKQLAKISERIATIETSYDEIIQKLWEEYELTVQSAREFFIGFDDENQLKKDLAAVKNAIKRLGNVNVGAIEEYKEVFEKYTFLKEQLKDLDESKQQLTKLITSLNGEMKTIFAQSFKIINTNFSRIFIELFGGGAAALRLTDTENILESGIEIEVSPPGKVIKSLTALSGGEQSLVAISIYFAILAHNPSPFCILDEIEAALDDVNVTRYASYLHRISQYTQFIVITHRRGTMESADVLYGVTMQEDGISKLLKLDANNISPSLIN